MHTLNRNKRDLWYALLTGKTELRNADGLLTGESEFTYSDPVKVRMSMSISSGANNLGSQGMVTLEPYGITTAYTHRMVTEDMSCPINEESLIWIGKEPTETVNGEVRQVPHNFKVVRVARSLNHIISYVKEVDVSG